MIIGSFFLLNLFVGVVISSFNRQKDHLGGLSALTELQRDWVETRLTLLKCQPVQKARMPEYRFGQLCYRLNYSKWFDAVIYGCIIANTLILCIQWGG
jgi:hypothetical protein